MSETTDNSQAGGRCAPAPGSEILTTEEKLIEDRKRLEYLRSKAKYAPPVKGMFGGAWQITLTVGPGETVAPDFFNWVALGVLASFPQPHSASRSFEDLFEEFLCWSPEATLHKY